MIKPVHWTTLHELIPNESIQAIHEASLRILERTGLVMPLHPERRQQARDLDLQVDDESQRVRFPPQVVEAILKKAPQQYTLYARNPENNILLDGQHGYLSLDGSGTQVLDPQTGEVRDSTKTDLEAAIRLADALPQISFLWPTVSARDCPARVQPLHELEALLTQSAKHAQAMTVVDGFNARGAVEMAAAVAGGQEALRERPVISNFQCSVSPLSYEAHALEAAFVFGEAGIPTGFLAMPIGCATAPATLAGIAAQANAEVLAGIVLFELFFPGAPTFYGACPTMLELHTGGITSGGPEDFLLQAVGCQLAHSYNIPASIGTFATGAKDSGWQAGAENSVSGMINHLSGADMMSGAGLLNGARIFSFEQLVMDCEIFDMLAAVTQGFEVNEETLALDLIDSIGPQKHFMASKHTRNHMREVWQPRVMDRSAWEDWQANGQPSARERARQIAREQLSGPAPQPPGWAQVVWEIVTAYEQMG